MKLLLLIDDSASDADPIVVALGRAGFEVESRRVESADSLREVLSESWDAVLWGYGVSGIGPAEALRIVRTCSEWLPFILVSRAVGEEWAGDVMAIEADDYVIRDDLTCLGLVVRQNVAKAKAIRERQEALEALARSEAQARLLVATASEVVIETDRLGRIVNVDGRLAQMLGCDHEGFRGQMLREVVSKDHRSEFDARWEAVCRGRAERLEIRLAHRQGEDVWVLASMAPWMEGRVLAGSLVMLDDITARKTAEQRLRESEERFFKAFRANPALSTISDLETGCILEVNEAWLKTFGFDRDEVMGRSVMDLGLLTADQRDSPIKTTCDLKSGKGIEVEAHNKAGECLVLLLGGEIIEFGGQKCVLSAAADVTEQKKTERARQEAYAMLMKLAERVPGMIYQFRSRPDGKACFPWTSPAIVDVFEVRPEDVQEDAGPVYERLHPDDRARVLELIEESARILERFQVEYRVVLPRRGARWHLADAVPERTEDGGTIWHGIIRDITELKDAEAALKMSQAKLENAMQLTDLVNWEFEVESGIFTFDDRFYALYGTSAAREGGYQMSADEYTRRFVHPDEQDLMREQVDKAIHAVDPNYRSYLEHRMVRRDGEVRHIVVRFGITKDEDGRTVKTHGANQDITGRKRAEEERQDLQVQLLQAQKMEELVGFCWTA